VRARKVRRSVVFDIDGTITRHVSSWRYIHEKLGLWDVLAKKYQQQFLAGKISYRRFCELDAAHWKGISEEELRNVFLGVQYSKNAEKVITKLKDEGYFLVAVSTGLQFLAERLRTEMGFDRVICNRLNVRRGKMTGGVRINITHGGKGKALGKVVKKDGLGYADMVVVGDSDGDISMMRKAGYSIAFNSCSEKLEAAADHICKTGDFDEVYSAIRKFSSRVRS
jgi:phosphoserine phosphatase